MVVLLAFSLKETPVFRDLDSSYTVSPLHFYCFPSTTTTTTATTFLLFSLHHHRHISIVFPLPQLYIFRLANHLSDVHQLDHIQRRQYLQEAKLQPKVKVVVYESEADNSAKKITQLVLAVQYRHKERCTNCQDHEKMESLSKKKLKEQLQRTRQTERNKKKVELLA